MESHEVLREAVEVIGAKKAAAALGVSTSLIYKWCEASKDPELSSGARNPLDRLLLLLETTSSDWILQWLCTKRDGSFVTNPQLASPTTTADYVQHTQKMLQEFSDLLSVMSESITNDGRIDEDEAARIRRGWEELKCCGEGFVQACEKGAFKE